MSSITAPAPASRPSPPTARPRRTGHRPVLSRPQARESRGRYDVGTPGIPPALARLDDLPVPDDPTDPAGTHEGRDDHDEHPFGLPVLSEVPQLAMMLQNLRTVDRLLAEVIDAILLMEDTGLAEATTGVGIDTWLSIVGRRTGADARMLRATAAVMRRIPTLHGAFRTGSVSWAQVRSVVLAVRPLPGHLDDRVDAAIGDALAGTHTDARTEPDALTRTIRWHLAAIDPTEVEHGELEADRAEYLAMQPRLDGTGGRFWGELGPTNFAILDAALNTGLVGDRGGDGADDDSARRVPGSSAPTPVAAVGRARLHRLIEHVERSLSLGPAPGRTDDVTVSTPAGATPGGPMRSRMQLLLRADLTTLLDRDRTPGWLLTSVLGGHVRISADTARRLIDERGADLRTVILDDTGSVVGVGRRARIAPGWLTDATLALHDTCATPGCDVAARNSQTDHARPWHPARPDDARGSTDIDQLGPGCARHNLTKERDGWVVAQRADGTRRWHHPRSGLTTTTVPVESRAAPPDITSGVPPDP